MRSDDGGNLSRTKSIVGTVAYMAPEIICMFGKRTAHADGYTTHVDWWSLGIAVYTMATGSPPFQQIGHALLKDVLEALFMESKQPYELLFYEVFGCVDYSLLDDTTKLLVNGLLEFTPGNRLGGESLRSHCYFDGTCWDDVESKSVMPPFIPSDEFIPRSTPAEKTMGELLQKIDRCKYWCYNSDDEEGDHPNPGPQQQVPKVGALRSMLATLHSGNSVRVSTEILPSSPNNSSGQKLNQFKVSEANQKYFYGWNFVSNELVEE